MLTVKENERLTWDGAGTPMGELMRRYWQPIAASVELDDKPVMRVKLPVDEQGIADWQLMDNKQRLGHNSVEPRR